MKKTIRLILGIVRITFGVVIIFVLGFPFMLHRIKQLKKHGEKVQATVINSTIIPRLDGKYRARITYEFMDQAGNKIKKTVGSSEKLQAGDNLGVIYLPNKPSVNCPETAIESMSRVTEQIIDGDKSYQSRQE